ncbi:hypothetical protein L5515_019703 [Caenorhabditis briggsae]|uniref:Uncharacterized protein n=1 Tax=Caenorhabditis briggsae TaxID=6238 RepID=A0AAE8ZXX9_CAEBR|nr:hypothetical protein L3Y34_013881 [Caenorhabditis briggsae]UMM44571.1 hypothetical protein L5515_019703 [Caenorhabditis briggsae]
MLLMTNSMLLPIGFSIERLYALKNAENYEREKVFLGPILVIILQDKKRSSKVASNIAMVSTGQEGALNYENVTRNIWESAGN